MKRPSRRSVTGRKAPLKPYHLVGDKKGRRTILCAIGDCVHVFSEIPAFNQHLSGVHGRKQVLAVVEFAETRRMITGSSATGKLDQQVKHTYRLWKQQAKLEILERLRQNLKDTLMREYNITEEEASAQGGLDDDILDSSDEEP
ncbi:hypothetical protein R1sor_001916 [Riccia sorocarpa]|uniref:C2H2-type domain-containing protein n=1 Tax=Riccia sorocarpa TaxID=122646 RepID=A0ABD3GZZ2_9MARC